MTKVISPTNRAQCKPFIDGRLLFRTFKPPKMKMEKIYIQHEENKLWMNNLNFYADEINIMENRLQEIAVKNTSKDVLMQIEHFQNQLIIQRNKIDELKHEINLDNDIIHKEIQKNEVAVDHRMIKDHTPIRIRMEVFERIFRSIRKDMNFFLGKVM